MNATEGTKIPEIVKSEVIEEYKEKQVPQIDSIGIAVLNLDIVNGEQKAKGQSLLANIRDGIKVISEKRLSWTRPLMTHKKLIDAEFTPMEKKLKSIEETLISKLQKYDMAEMAKREAEEKRLREEAVELEAEKEAEAKRLRLLEANTDNPETVAPIAEQSQAIIDNKETEIVQQTEANVAPPKTVVSESGDKMTTRMKWVGEVVEVGLLPRSVLSWDKHKSDKMIAHGIRNIPGMKIYQIPIYATKKNTNNSKEVN